MDKKTQKLLKVFIWIGIIYLLLRIFLIFIPIIAPLIPIFN
mgnify:CR=1 FL=1